MGIIQMSSDAERSDAEFAALKTQLNDYIDGSLSRKRKKIKDEKKKHSEDLSLF